MAKKLSETDHIARTRDLFLDQALPHVRFDGWRQAFIATCEESDLDSGLIEQAFPRGAIDLALAFHIRSDEALRTSDMALGGLRYRDKVAKCIQTRLEIAAPHREAVRMGSALFALPQNTADGAKAIWHTADTIWSVLGDTSRDINWYTKRMTLSAVYSSVVLYWLGDETVDFVDTTAFIDRRIENVMQFEKAKAGFRKTPIGHAIIRGTAPFLSGIVAPDNQRNDKY